MKPLIAISAAELRSEDNWLPPLYGQFSTYTAALVDGGGLPFIIPIVKNTDILRALYDKCQGLLLSGGGDINPVLYNADLTPHTERFSPERDEQELQLLKWALEDDRPILGICRGMQLINVAMGGSLHQDVTADLPDSRNHSASADKKDFNHMAHKLKVVPNSKLAAILQATELSTNAFHHQAIDKLGSGLIVTATAEDGVIEAVELPGKKFVIGVQSHPEAIGPEAENKWAKLFEAFVAAAI